MQTISQVLAILIASLLTIALSYFKISIITYQQILIVLMIAALIFYNFYSSRKTIHKIPSFLFTFVVLLFSTFFVQLLVISTGAVFSPFFILFHLYSITLSFLLSFLASLAFVLLTLISLGVNIYFNPNELKLIKDDPGTVLLYGVSFLVIIPLAQIITKKYHIKDELSKILSHKVQVGESVLESLSELVVITDPNLKIVSVNEALKRLLNTSDSEVVDKNLFDILILKDSDEQPATLESVSIDKVLVEHTSRIVSGFLLFVPSKVAPFRVSIQIRPIIDGQGKIDQLSFVITEGQGISSSSHDIEEAFKDQENRIEMLREELKKRSLSNLDTQVELIDKTEQDILILEEIEDHGIKERSILTDVAELTQNIVNIKQIFASSLGVALKFNLEEDDTKEASMLALKKQNVAISLLSSDFTTPLDPKWVKILISEIIDIAILLSINTNNRFVEIHLIKNPDPSLVNINITTSFSIIESDNNFLFEKFYPKLKQKKILNLSTGLEGFISKTIANQLNIPLIIRNYTNHTAFIISLERKVR